MKAKSKGTSVKSATKAAEPFNTAKFQAKLKSHVHKLERLSKTYATLTTAPGRDPKKEAQVKRQIIGLITSMWGLTSTLADQGIPAVVLWINTMVMQHWSEGADIYWEAKGL